MALTPLCAALIAALVLAARGSRKSRKTAGITKRFPVQEPDVLIRKGENRTDEAFPLTRSMPATVLR